MKLERTILIVEDELLVAHTMKKMLEEIGYRDIKLASSETLAESILKQNLVDLAILDINLGKGTEGLHLAKVANECGIPFFFVSSYSDKVILDKALAETPGAYLIKPFVQANLYTALNITVKANVPTDEVKVTFKDGTNTVKVSSGKILYLRADNNYVEIVTSEKKYFIRNTLHKVSSMLPKDQFAQVHRSYIINLKQVRSVKSGVIQVGDQDVPISRTFKNKLKQLII